MRWRKVLDYDMVGIAWSKHFVIHLHMFASVIVKFFLPPSISSKNFAATAFSLASANIPCSKSCVSCGASLSSSK